VTGRMVLRDDAPAGNARSGPGTSLSPSIAGSGLDQGG
jgi:hypothetical protein